MVQSMFNDKPAEGRSARNATTSTLVALTETRGIATRERVAPMTETLLYLYPSVLQYKYAISAVIQKSV
eukprot:254703-Rhodomonas_salina.1